MLLSRNKLSVETVINRRLLPNGVVPSRSHLTAFTVHWKLIKRIYLFAKTPKIQNTTEDLYPPGVRRFFKILNKFKGGGTIYFSNSYIFLIKLKIPMINETNTKYYQ